MDFESTKPSGRGICVYDGTISALSTVSDTSSVLSSSSNSSGGDEDKNAYCTMQHTILALEQSCTPLRVRFGYLSRYQATIQKIRNAQQVQNAQSIADSLIEELWVLQTMCGVKSQLEEELAGILEIPVSAVCCSIDDFKIGNPMKIAELIYHDEGALNRIVRDRVNRYRVWKAMKLSNEVGQDVKLQLESIGRGDQAPASAEEMLAYIDNLSVDAEIENWSKDGMTVIMWKLGYQRWLDLENGYGNVHLNAHMCILNREFLDGLQRELQIRRAGLMLLQAKRKQRYKFHKDLEGVVDDDVEIGPSTQHAGEIKRWWEYTLPTPTSRSLRNNSPGYDSITNIISVPRSPGQPIILELPPRHSMSTWGVANTLMAMLTRQSYGHRPISLNFDIDNYDISADYGPQRPSLPPVPVINEKPPTSTSSASTSSASTSPSTPSSTPPSPLSSTLSSMPSTLPSSNSTTATPVSVNIQSGSEKKSVEGSEETICVICRSEPRTTAFVPCGHMATCNSCAQLSLASTRKCPICRTEVTSLLRIYH